MKRCILTMAIAVVATVSAGAFERTMAVPDSIDIDYRGGGNSGLGGVIDHLRQSPLGRVFTR